MSDAARNWIQKNLVSGGSPQAIVESMIANGLDADFANAAVAGVMASINERAGNYLSRATHLPGGALIHTHDRTIPVLVRLARPRVTLLSSVISDSECEELIELARPRLRASTVIDPETGRDIVTTYWRSEGMFFRIAENLLIERLDLRLSELMGHHVEHGEGLQVMRYSTGGESSPHFDFLHGESAADRESLARSGQRVATLIVYLNDVAVGGETFFPTVGFSVQPQKGNGLYFEYCDSRGECDRQSLHGGAPVQAGEKWVVTKWMRERRFVARGSAP